MTTGRKLTRRECLRLPAAGMLGAVLASRTQLLADKASATLAEYAQRIDQALDRALAFLAAQQQKDGSFKTMMRGNTGITSLCVMAFLAKGHTPGAGPYGEVINRGIDFVVSQQSASGVLIKVGRSHGAMYSHGIATLMLSEVSGMLTPERQKRVDQALGKALKLILAAQKIRKPAKHQGGWRYQATSRDSDISLTGWSLMALRSARNNGASVPLESIEAAVKFVMNCRMPDGGFAYQPGSGSGLARTGTALLCLELCGRHRSAACIGAGKYILARLPKNYGANFFYYGLYHCSQGMFQLGGANWERFAVHMYKMMLDFQNKKDGSWPQGGGSEAKAGVCYSTAMGALALSVSYRQLPIYQR